MDGELGREEESQSGPAPVPAMEIESLMQQLRFDEVGNLEDQRSY